MAPKGEFEITYLGMDNAGNQIPCGGLDYSRPYSILAPNALAPGTVNTQSINGFLTGSPWVADSTFSTLLADQEYVMGIFPYVVRTNLNQPLVYEIVVTNIGVYYVNWNASGGNPITRPVLATMYLWIPGTDLFVDNLVPGVPPLSFVEINSTLYFTGIMLQGIYAISFSDPSLVFNQATSYVSAAFLFELGGRLVAAECQFPTGGGTGVTLQPTIAWSGVNAYEGSGASDPWNPVNALGGGFNLLSDVPDQITGVAAIGRSAFIFRDNGITQQDPGPSGIEPFVWYHLWASPQGVGALPNTVAQFGQQVVFRSSDNIYSISLTGGVQPIGPQIIAKVNGDWRAAGLLTSFNYRIGGSHGIAPNRWNTASIVRISGQLHYLLTMSAVGKLNNDASTPQFTCVIYDINLGDGSWHFWDLSQYTTVLGIPGISTAVAQIPEIMRLGAGSAGVEQFALNHLDFGLYTAYNFGLTEGGAHSPPSGQLYQFVPLNYDFTTNPYVGFLSNVVAQAALPLTTIVFRGETVTLGHKITCRRLRLQADNAPQSPTGQQQATVTLTADDPYPVTSSVINMRGSQAPQGNPIRTYYGDFNKSAEMLQASLTTQTAVLANVCLFRLATVSFIGIDATSTTQ